MINIKYDLAPIESPNSTKREKLKVHPTKIQTDQHFLISNILPFLNNCNTLFFKLANA